MTVLCGGWTDPGLSSHFSREDEAGGRNARDGQRHRHVEGSVAPWRGLEVLALQPHQSHCPNLRLRLQVNTCGSQWPHLPSHVSWSGDSRCQGPFGRRYIPVNEGALSPGTTGWWQEKIDREEKGPLWGQPGWRDPGVQQDTWELLGIKKAGQGQDGPRKWPKQTSYLF